jgi:hypothetical protein
MQQPDMEKVRAALSRYAPKRINSKPATKRTPNDAALRKPLKAHGTICRGFGHRHFLNND